MKGNRKINLNYEQIDAGAIDLQRVCVCVSLFLLFTLKYYALDSVSDDRRRVDDSDERGHGAIDDDDDDDDEKWNIQGEQSLARRSSSLMTSIDREASPSATSVITAPMTGTRSDRDSSRMAVRTNA